MKKICFVFIISFISILAYAQIHHVNKEEMYNTMSKYIGKWRYTDNETVFTIELDLRYDTDMYVLFGKYSIYKQDQRITDEFQEDFTNRNSEDYSIKGYYCFMPGYIDIIFRDRGNKNREAGSGDSANDFSYLRIIDNNKKECIAWHIRHAEGKAYFVNNNDEAPKPLWTVPTDCILEKVE